MAVHVAFAAGLVGVSLLGGMWGYGYYEHLGWRDAFLNTAMLLGGMGPVDPLRTNGGEGVGRVFSLYAGMGFFVLAGGYFSAAVLSSCACLLFCRSAGPLGFSSSRWSRP